MAKFSSLKAIKPVFAKEEFEDDDDKYDSSDVDEEQHSKVLDAMKKLDGKKKLRIITRTEPVSKINEHALVQVGTGDQTRSTKLTVANALAAITAGTDKKVAKNLKKAQKKKQTLDAPLEKPQALRVQRTVGYEKVKTEVSKWDSIVKSNRQAEQLIFPLMEPAIHMPTAKEFSSKFKPATPLEQQISELLRGSKHVPQADEVLSAAEKEALSSMSLKEALERRKELARIRVLQSYQEAKARRQNKIKSKKYHRLLKREKMKNHLKEFETLKEDHPDEALEKLQELEKRRVEERMTLKHKGAGKWAKMQAIRSKYDEEAREALAEQLRVGKEMTRKVQEVEESSDDEAAGAVSANPSSNPWLQQNGSDAVEAVEDNGTSYRKLWNSVNESKAIKRKNQQEKAEEEDEVSEGEEEDEEEDEELNDEDVKESETEEVEAEAEAEEKEEAHDSESEAMENKFSEEMDESLVRKTTMEDFAVSAVKPKAKRVKQSAVAARSIKTPKIPNPKPKAEPPTKKKVEEIDPNAFMSVPEVTLKSTVAVTEEGAEEEDEEEAAANERRMTLAEAFADDDVVEQFKEDKKRVVDGSVPADIDLTLPGWGEWGGSGLKVSKRKRKRFIIKAPPAEKRRDENKGNLIINEDKNTNMRKQQVSELPFPFRSVAAYESTIRAPVTSTFLPQTAVRKLTEPKIIKKVGTVIHPMTEEALVSNANHNGGSDGEDNDDDDNNKKGSDKNGKKRKDRRRQKSKPYNKSLTK